MIWTKSILMLSEVRLKKIEGMFSHKIMVIKRPKAQN